MTSGGGLFQRQGGKSKQRKQILKRFPPTSEYNTYVEPFLGGGSIALEAPIVKRMIAGDTDKRVIDIFKLVKKLDSDTIRQLDFRRNAKLFEELKNSKPKSDLGILYKLLYLTFHSHPQDFGYMIYRGSTGTVFKNKLDDIKEVLDHYTIVKRDYKQLISKYDSPSTFFYLDPPYYKTDVKAYETGGIDHDELAEILRGIKGKFLLSNNDDPYIRKLYKGYHITSFMSYQGGHHKMVKEILISNY